MHDLPEHASGPRRSWAENSHRRLRPEGCVGGHGDLPSVFVVEKGKNDRSFFPTILLRRNSAVQWRSLAILTRTAFQDPAVLHMHRARSGGTYGPSNILADDNQPRGVGRVVFNDRAPRDFVENTTGCPSLSFGSCRSYLDVVKRYSTMP